MPEEPKKRPIKKNSEETATPETAHLDALSERLYARGNADPKIERTKLTRTTTPANRDWSANTMKERIVKQIEAGNIARPAMQKMNQAAASVRKTIAALPKTAEQFSARTATPPNRTRTPDTIEEESMGYPKKARTYRRKILFGGFIFFIAMMLLSSLFFIFGNNSISGENITIAVTGDFALGGGEKMPISIAVANENDVAIESATLIVDYPAGTQKPDGSGAELFNERFPLEDLKPGEVRTIETSAIIFGEENSEKTINVSIEYRVRGSNATFYKDAEPLRFKISTSPVVILIDAAERLTAGQEAYMTLTVASNSGTPLEDVLVQLQYPSGFDYSSSEPSPVSGQNVWRIDTLDPEESVKITVEGILGVGRGGVQSFTASAGVSNNENEFALSSVYTTNSFDIDIETAALGTSMTINGQQDDVTTLSPNEEANVRIEMMNTGGESIYDGRIMVDLSGSALSGIVVTAPDGFYDSNSQTITWDGSDVSALRDLAPGNKASVTFTLRPNTTGVRTPEITLAAEVTGNRTSGGGSEAVVGTESRTIRVASSAQVSSELTHEDNIFNNSGPVPPVVGETTTYTATFFIQNGSNEVGGATLTATLPQYVAWKASVTSGDNVSFDQTTRTMIWDIGNISANGTASASVQLGMTPSSSQVGQVPIIVETQQFKGTDKFTGATTRASASSLNAVLLEEGVGNDSGKVEAD